MSRKARKRTKYGSGKGPPRKSGDRHPSGELKRAPAPNATVVTARKVMLGAEPTDRVDISKAENPLDLVLARGWITEEDHRAARAYAALYRRAGVDLPRMKTANHQEGEGEYSREARRAGVVETSVGIRPTRDLDGDATAHDTLKLIWAACTAEERTELLNLCILEAWPRWITLRIWMRPIGADEARRQEAFMQALVVVRTILDPRRKRGQHSRNDMVAEV